MPSETIAAIATGDNQSAVNMIRLSGDESLTIAGRLIGKDLSRKEGHTLHYGTITEDGKPVDEVLIGVFHAPKSYTGEDVAEICVHGGVYLTRKVLSLVIGEGARLAERGEFTRRAFLNGKLDLAEAEAVNDLISARDAINAQSAAKALKGSVRKILDPLVEELTQLIANIEVNIDYPEYDDIKQLTEEEILPRANKWLADISRLIQSAEDASLIKEGVDTVILGKPNVGKSSLLNALLEEDKAIVTEVAGTTRDTVEGTVTIGGVTLNLIDTAGIHETGDAIEKMGIERTVRALDKAKLVIVVLEAGERLTGDDRKLLAMTEGKPRLIVYNKKDKKDVKDGIAVSALNRDIEALTEAIRAKYSDELAKAQSDTFTNARQMGLALQARKAVEEAVKTLADGLEADLALIDLERAWRSLKTITGEVGSEALLDEIFSRFCLGK